MKKAIFTLLLLSFRLIALPASTDSLFSAYNNATDDTTKLKISIQLMNSLRYSQPDSAIVIGQKGLQIADKYLDSRNKAIQNKSRILKGELYNFIGVIYADKSDYERSLGYQDSALTVFEAVENLTGMGQVYNDMGIVYRLQSNYPEALKYFRRYLKITEKQDFKKGVGQAHNNIGMIYYHQRQYDKALEQYIKYLEISEQINNIADYIIASNNIGEIYHIKQAYDKALEYYQQGIAHAEQQNANRLLAYLLGNVGNLYQEQDNYSEAIKAQQRSLKIRKQIGDKQGVAIAHANIARMHLKLSNYKTAQTYARKSLDIAGEIGALLRMKEAYGLLYRISDSLGHYNDAYGFHKRFKAINDSVFNKEKHKQIAELETKYETEKKEQRIKLQAAEIEKNQAQIARQKARQKMLYIVLAAVVLVIVVFAFAYYQKQKDNKKIARQRDEIKEKNAILEQQKEEILTQAEYLQDANEKITEQKQKIEETHKQIEDSIHYASRIQQALMPSYKFIQSYFPESFVMLKPRDVVSGDFFWARKIEDYFLITAADCTGHGVPGAFVSMLGIAFLNEIVRKSHISDAGQVLNELRDEIKKALNQKQGQHKVDDGMDLAFIAIDLKNKYLHYAGAHNPLIVIHKNEEAENNYVLTEYKADRMPVSSYIIERPFKNQEVEIQAGDRFYMFSDGFSDQMGGPKGKKFYKKNLKRLLLQIQEHPMQQQQKLLEQKLKEWQGTQYDQIDDILIMGLEYHPENFTGQTEETK